MGSQGSRRREARGEHRGEARRRALPLQLLRLEELPCLPPATRSFFLRPTPTVAQELLGGWLVRRSGASLYGARLTEVEAYLGVDDPAAHSFRGRRTARVDPMYQAGGHLYVFLVYGMHCCANIVTREEGVPQAVLLRAAEAPVPDHPRLLAGPARLCRGLAIDRRHSGLDLLTHPELSLLPDPQPPRVIEATPRIGIDYAGEAAQWPLRYYLSGSPAVSGPRPLRRPAPQVKE